MRIEQRILMGMMAAGLGAMPGVSASIPDAGRVQTRMVITALGAPPATVGQGDVTVIQGKAPDPVVRTERLAGDLADMQLFVLLDDSTRTTGLGVHLAELKSFIQSLPPTTQVAVGYMRNGTFVLSQTFTGDHQKAGASLRLPNGEPGENGSPYIALSDLVKRWPSKEPTNRRAVLMLTDGVDRYFTSSIVDDPYVDTAIREALKQGVMVYSVYLRGAGLYGRGGWTTNVAQSRLTEVGDQTGGFSYFQAFSDPVSLDPFMKDLRNRLDNQYRLTIAAAHEKGVQPVKLHTELPGAKISGPTRIYIP